MSRVEKGTDERPFSYSFFVITNIPLYCLLILILWVSLPHSVWIVQAPWEQEFSLKKFVWAFILMKLVNSFIEYFFHRYVLHKAAVPLLSYFYRQHTTHHGLTSIGRRRAPLSGKEIPYIVENNYEITEPEQAEASFFPWYSLIVFAVVLTPLAIVLQLVAPSFPWFTAGYSALLLSLFLYEIVHAIEHRPVSWWNQFLEHRIFGGMWRKAYSFHLRHHAVITCNESISGFFTLPVTDIMFGTFILPKSLYIDGGEWKESEFIEPRPYWFIRQCDRLAMHFVNVRRARRTRKQNKTESA